MARNKFSLRAGLIALALIIGIGTLFHASGVSAQEFVEAGNVGLDQIQETSGLGDSSFGQIIGQIIRIVLSLLGLVTIVMVIYGGFLYMTSSGNEESIDKAKRTLANGVIGLVIVLSSYMIAEFVIRSVGNATGTDVSTILGTDSGGNIDGGEGGFISGSGGTSGSLQVKTIVPKGTQSYANLQVVVAFTQNIDETSVKDHATVTTKDGQPVAGTWSVKGDSISFAPSANCPAPNADRRCFESGKEYKVTIVGGKNGIVSATSKKPLTCSATNCTATFVAGDKVDVKGPDISNLEPRNNEKIPVDQIVPMQALLRDDAAIGFGRIEVDGVVIETLSPSDARQEYLMVTRKFHTKGDKVGKEYTVVVTAQDLAGNEAKVSYKVQAAVATCFNKLKDGDETDIDCSAAGGACGICPNVKCQTSLQCTNGSMCDDNKKICVSAPIIKTVEPQDGAPGTYVTLTGVGFGTQFGDVFFEGDPSTEADDVQAALACAGSWSDTQAVVRVPDTAKSGPIALRNNAGSKDQTDDQDGIMLRAFTVNDVQRPGLCTVTPVSGQSGKTKIVLTGNEFLTNASFERVLFIGGYKVDAAWGSDGAGTASAITPFLYPGKTTIQLTAKSVPSNPLDFFVEAAGTGSVSGSGTGSGSGSTGSGNGSSGNSGSNGNTNTGGGSSTTNQTAKINSLSPQKGGFGQYVTINGSGFGSTPNRVYFVVLDKNGKMTSDQTIGDISFPPQCAKSFWEDTQTIVKVPNLAPGTYAIVVQPYGNVPESTYKTFEITTDKPGAQVCAVEPAKGPADGKTKITLYGDNFGDAFGAVVFGNKSFVAGNATGSSWSRTATSVIVPSGTGTGEVRVAQSQSTMTADVCVKNPSACSNAVTYTVADCRSAGNSCGAGTMCCGDGSCQKNCAAAEEVATPVKGVFAWCFSTGDSCDAIQPPRIIESCSAEAVSIPSPAPSSMWKSTETAGACANTMISISFTEPVDPATVDISSGSASALVVEECISEDGLCTEVASQPIGLSNLRITDQVDGKNAGLFAVPTGLKGSTTYRVTLKNSIVGSETGMQILPPVSASANNTCKPDGNGIYCYYFKTSANQGACDIDSVGIAPSAFTADNLGPIIDPISEFKDLQYWLPLARPSDKCQVLNPDTYAWTWAPTKPADAGYEFATPLGTTGSRMSVLAKQPTASKNPTQITVTENKSKKSGSGSLIINMGAPVLAEACEIDGPRSPSPSAQWGGDICFSAPIVVEFNQPVVAKGNAGRDSEFSVKVSECTGPDGEKKCDTLSPNSPLATTRSYRQVSETRHIYEFNTVAPRAKSTTYLVEIPTTTKSLGVYGKTMAQKQGCRAGVAHCFTFTTAADEESCKIKRVEVMPFDWRASEYGIQKTFNETGDSVDKKWFAQGFGSNPCVWLNNTYSWNWNIDADHTSFAAIDPPTGRTSAEGLIGKYWDTSHEQIVAAYKETAGEDRVKIQASTLGITGSGVMTIKFPTPTVVKYEPSACGATSVCANSALSVSFSTAMITNSFAGNAYAYPCPDDACDFNLSKIPQSLPLTASRKNITGRDYSLVPFQLGGSGTFALNKKYRVILRNGIQSTATKGLGGMNYPANAPAYFSWTFTVTKDQCAVDRVVVNPVSATARSEGETREFIALAYTAPDTCYPEGQLLSGSGISWSWSTDNNDVADILSVTTTFAQTFKMIGKGEVTDNVQVAKITATTGVRSGSSEWKLECNAPPASCPAGTWAGNDKCCHLPPSVVATHPKAGDTGVCRNTLITFDVNDVLDPNSVSTSTVQLGFQSTQAECQTTYDKGFCFGEIPFTLTSVSNRSKDGVDSARVVLNLLDRIPENKKVVLRVRPTGSDNPAQVGLRSNRGVPVLGTEVQFTTGTNFCEITDVAVFPESALFTKTSDSQQYIAYGLSKQGNDLLPISSIPNIYAWGWEWFSNDTKIAKIESADAAKTVQPIVVPGGINGQTSVTALAQIIADTAIKPSTLGRTVAGAGSVESMLCEIPWIPERNATLKTILEQQSMSFWYCRVAENTLLPSLTVVEDKLSDLSLSTLRSFRLVDGEAGGAIGFRVEKNLKQYSPYEWYLQREFKGEPQRISVDGFEAVRVGNTIYAGFANKTPSGSQYTNILVASLSEPASENMKAIFNQIVGNLQFATNVLDVGLCTLNGQPVNKSCNTDLACGAVSVQMPPQNNRVFGLDNGRILNDEETAYYGVRCELLPSKKYTAVWINRQTGISTDISGGDVEPTAVSSYCAATPTVSVGHCQKQPNVLCASNSNCMAGDSCLIAQQCNAEQSKFRRDMIRVVDASSMVRAIDKAQAFAQKYPIIAQNSFIPGLASSKWPAWESFMQQLGIEAVTDPLNTYAACGPDSDPQTCWSVKNKNYQCAAGSSVYHYRSVSSGQSFELGIPLEQSAAQQGSWAGEWVSGAKTKVVNNFCTGSSVVGAAVCGDGAIGPGEECDPAGSPVSGVSALCSAYGDFTATCSATCKIENLQCISKCGDGVVQPEAEDCDDGAKYNGKYNYCGANCKVASTAVGMCGDGIVQISNEACDVGTAQGRTFLIAKDGSGDFPYPSLYSGYGVDKIYGIRCESSTEYATMVFDVSENKLFSADRITDSVYKDAAEDLIDKNYSAYCSITEPVGLCSGYPALSCTSESNCPEDSVCIKPATGTKYAKTKNNSCNWNCKSTGSYCGDGIVDALNGEQCDGDATEVNAVGNQCVRGCTNSCSWELTAVNSGSNTINESVCVEVTKSVTAAPSCGDGKVDPSLGEECDAGKPQNGTPCTPLYGAQNSCQYCTDTCKKGFVTGGFCGDGKADGSEMCDGADIPKVCDSTKFDYNTYSCTNQCTLDQKSGSCQSCMTDVVALNTAGADQTKITRSAAIVLDPTIGMMPAPVFARINMVREGVVGEGPLELFAAGLLGVKAAPSQIGYVAKVNDIAFSNRSACVTKEHGFRITLGNLGYPVGKITAQQQEALDAFNSLEHGFYYDNKIHDFLSEDDLKKDQAIEMQPAGADGSYRIVINENDPENDDTFIPSLTIGSTEAPGSKAYLVGDYEPVVCKTGWGRYMDLTGLISFLTFSGCRSDEPYAIYNQIDKSLVYTVYKNDDFFPGRIYNLSFSGGLVVGKIGGFPVTKGVAAGFQMKIYKKTNGTWGLVKSVESIKEIPGNEKILQISGANFALNLLNESEYFKAVQ